MSLKPEEQPQGQKATFFDSHQRSQGSAGRVVQRAPSLGGLTVLQISDSEPSLAAFIVTLDRKALRVECVADGPKLFFKWASGYSDGKAMRIQGVLERK